MAKQLKNKSKKSIEKNTPKPVLKQGDTSKQIKNFDLFNKIIVSPHFSEKSSKGEILRKYIFKVSNTANKSTLKKELEKIYNVKIGKINILKNRKKIKVNQKGSSREKRPDIKKAIVTLAKNQKLDALKI